MMLLFAQADDYIRGHLAALRRTRKQVISVRFIAQGRRRGTAFFLAAVLMSFGFVAFGPVSPAAATYPACGTVLVSGSNWAGGNGVDVHSNGSDETTGNSCGSTGVFNLGASPPQWGSAWQCVELAARMYKTQGWSNGLPGVSYAAQIYTMASTLNMTAMAQGSIVITKIVPGDMVVSDQATYGHVSLVDSVDVANNAVHVVEQNAGGSGTGTYTYDPVAQKLTRGTYYTVTGVVHSPNNTLTNSGGGGSTSSTPQIIALKRTYDPNGVRQVYAATNTAVTEGWWIPGGDGVHTHEIITIAQHNIVGFDKVDLPDGTQALYTAVADGVWETWWKPDGTTGTDKIVTGLSGIKGVIAYNDTESGQFVHHLYILAGDGPYEAWWKDGGDGVHLSLLTGITGGVTFTQSVGPDGAMQLYVAVPTWVYEVWWYPGTNVVHVGTIINITQGDVRSVAKDFFGTSGQLLYTGTSTTAWQSYWAPGQNIETHAVVVNQINVIQVKKTNFGDSHQLYVATNDHVQEYWWKDDGTTGGGELIRITQGNIGAIDKVSDGAAQDLYTGAGNWVYETWWSSSTNPSTSGLFQVAS